MATIVLSAVGAAAGASFGGGVLGLSSVVIGRAVGATLGRVLDQNILGAGSEPVETGRVDRFRLTSAGEGTAIAQVHGRMRVGAQVIWASKFREDVSTVGGGKGAPRRPETREYSYSISLALGLCEGEISRVGRVWADGREISPSSLDMRMYPGSEAQLPDPAIEAELGAGNVPAYRGLAYVMIENLALGPFGNRVPQFTFEIVRPEQDRKGDALTDMSRQIRAVAMMPGTGEYSLATTKVQIEQSPGVSAFVNVNTPSGSSDFATSVNALTAELPECRATSLIVSWFGSDLRCGACEIVPKVEQKEFDGKEIPWSAGGLSRADAETVPRIDGSVVYGGTPSDRSVIESIERLKASGQSVMFYPFILMEQIEGNAKPDPYGRASEQAPLPWRGRITLARAPGLPGSPDGTIEAEAEVAAFFGTARQDEFEWDGDRLSYGGQDRWSYRRFILHCAHLCARSGGVDSFCIGSEMRGLTQIRGASGFPAVQALVDLARDVREILGADAKVGYAADWSEYFGYRPDDGSGDLYFHLDPLWADDDIDFIGIDNYMPLSDWRDGPDHADAEHGSIYSLDYLKSNILGGEGYDWFYADDTARDEQDRTPISDGLASEAWVFRYKDIASWWSQPHFERRAGVRSDRPTAWAPASKPVWFTELGCAAIDKGANQPNKFLDPKSSESSLPWYSTGRRDDFMQLQYLRAMHEFWLDGSNNPFSPYYGGPMVDMSRAFVWAWDARPFPQFPGNSELWSDSSNYVRGHWISGRSSNRSLGSVVKEICARSGVADVDTDALYGIVRGYGISEIGGARAALQPLMLAFGFDAVERGGKLVFRSRDGRPLATIAESDVAVSTEIDGDIQAIRSPDAERAGRLRLNFIGADGDFDLQSAEAIFPDERSFGVSQSELPLMLTKSEGRAVTERWLAESRISRDRLRFALPPSRMNLGAGDVISLRDGLYRIDHVEQSGLQQIEAVRVEPGLYEPSDAAEETVVLKPFHARTAVLPVFLDLPLLSADSVPHAPYVAASARRSSGEVSVYSSPEDAGYTLNVNVSGSLTVGTTKTTLVRADPAVYDRGDALRVELITGVLESVSEGRLLAGANAVAIGSGRDDLWEIFQFRDARLVAPHTYDLSARLRGQLGTDAVMPDVWPEGSRVVLIDKRLPQIDLPLDARELERHYRIGPSSLPISDRTFVHEVRAFEGVGLRPFAPVHLSLQRDDAGLEATWIRRTRIGGDSWAGADVPLGEAAEAYRVRVLKDGKVIRTDEVASPRWRYSATAIADDGAAGSVMIEVAQLSDVYGAGPAVRGDIVLP